MYFLPLLKLVVSSLVSLTQVLLALVSPRCLLPLLPPSSSCSSAFSHLCSSVSFTWQLLLRSREACGLAWSPPQ